MASIREVPFRNSDLHQFHVIGKVKLEPSNVEVFQKSYESDSVESEDGLSDEEEKLDGWLHWLVFEKQLQTLTDLVKEKKLKKRDLEKKDLRFNTPLHLACKLSIKDDQYLEVVRLLLEAGAKFKTKDKKGWNVIDEAVSSSNIWLMGVLFDHATERKRVQWEEKRLQIVRKLTKIPDFYLEMSWEFDSSLVPFVGKMCPKDTYRIWKVGSSVWLDFSLAGYGKLKSKRRDLSLIFRNGQLATDENKDSFLLLLNRSRGILVDPLEPLDDEERIAVITDILNADAVKNDVWIENPEWRAAKGVFGGEKRARISGTRCQEFKIKVKSLSEKQ